MGFVRRFSNFPGREVLQEIEGVVTIDETPAGDISGVSQGVACLVGEFADVTFGVSIDANGVVTTGPQPVETFGSQDILDKVGGWDETLGEFGGDGGNGFLELKNRSFSRLVVVPINNAASHGVRLWRKLPTNVSATNPSSVVTVSGATVPAGREFKSGNNRVRVAQRVQFASTAEYKTATDGAITAAGAPAATQTLTSAGGGFTTVLRPDGTRGVQVGDALVLGVIGGAGALGANADTYRVQAVTSDTVLTLEKQSGATFDWTTGTAQPYRIHASDCADTGGIAAIASATGFRIPVRPLDATVTTNTNLAPTVIPPALTATSADPLSGLAMRTDATTGIVFVSNIHTPNTGSNADLDALYALAIESLIDDDLPEREVNILWSARSSSNIDTKGTNHVLEQKANGVGRMWLFSPPLDTTAIATAIGDSAPGTGANRAREGIYCWPGIRTFVNEAVGTLIKGADQLLYKTGELDTPSTGWAASILSKLAPERNPGQASDPVKTIMSSAIGIQRGVTGLGINQYKQLKAKGVMAPRLDRSNGMIFQSGVTRSIQNGEKEIYTRRFSFFVEDSIANALAPFVKELMTETLKDQVTGLVTDFLDDLLSVGNKSAARIKGYALDPKSGNTKELQGSGIFVIKYTIEMLDIANTIVQQASVGLGLLQIDTLAG